MFVKGIWLNLLTAQCLLTKLDMAMISRPQEFIWISVDCHNSRIVFVLHFLAIPALFTIFRSLNVLSEGLLGVRHRNFLSVFSLVTSFHMFYDSHISGVSPSYFHTLESYALHLALTLSQLVASWQTYVSSHTRLLWIDGYRWHLRILKCNILSINCSRDSFLMLPCMAM